MSNTTPTLPQGPQSQFEYGPQGPAYAPQPMSAAEAKAQAKAAKAHAKALRPWFKKKRFIGPIALVAIIGVVSVANGGGESDTTQSTTSAAAPAKPGEANADKAEAAKPEAKIGTPVATGDFEITITKVREGGKQVGDKYINEKADGHYELVSVTVKNTGDDASYFVGDNVKLVDDKGREFSADTAASILIADNNTLIEEINPGNTAKGVLAFDLPKGVDAEQASITGSIFDGPVVVTLN